MNRFSAMIVAVLSRPAMYTVAGAYGEVVAFLDGYFSGLSLGHADVASVSQWAEVSTFLSTRLGTPSSETFRTFQTIHGAESLEELRKIYNEFQLREHP